MANISDKPREGENIVSLFKELRDETTNLMHQEVELAKREMSEKAAKFGRNGIYAAVGGVVAYTGLLFILAALGFLVFVGLRAAEVSTAIAIWVAPLIVGIVVSLIGAGLLMKGVKAIKSESVLPERTIASLKEDKEWISHKGA